MSEEQSILRLWDITEHDLTELVTQNPSLRGIMLGYVAEKKMQDILYSLPGVTEITKDDDHDRTRKGDRRISYKEKVVMIEVKSIQTNSVQDLGNDNWTGRAQVDASDSRDVIFPNGSSLKTTCLLRNQFDLLAINCFAFGGRWRFAFALNSELPANTYRRYTEYQRSQLLPTMIRVDWPLQPPFKENLEELLELLADDGT